MRQLSRHFPALHRYPPARKRRHVPAFIRRLWDGVVRFAVVLVRPMIARLVIGHRMPRLDSGGVGLGGRVALAATRS